MESRVIIHLTHQITRATECLMTLCRASSCVTVSSAFDDEVMGCARVYHSVEQGHTSLSPCWQWHFSAC